MVRKQNVLEATSFLKKNKPGYYADGGGLYLQVSPTGSKSWVFRFTLNGRAREMGLGAVARGNALAAARDSAAECRRLLRQGKDPIEERKAHRAAARLEAAKTLTFRECAQAYIASHRAGWKNAKHADQWASTLETYAYPKLGDVPVAGVDTGLVMSVLDPIWSAKAETANRLRGRMELILAWATVREYRAGENPARWRGHLDKLLPPRAKVATVAHHPALPHAQIGAFVAAVRAENGTAARALEFAILTATRTSEVTGATIAEFDREAAVWTIPAARMKARKEHRVPLSPRAMEILKAAIGTRKEGYVFPGKQQSRPLSNMAMLALLKRMERQDITVHGFRSTFRDWAGETTAYPREVIEHALAHQLKDKAEAAYARGTLFDKRRRLMDEWATYCAASPAVGNVTGIRSKTAA